MATVQAKADDLIRDNKVMIFSKSHCPHCAKAKKVFKELGQAFKAIELDQVSDGGDIQGYLVKKTCSRTVPQVFVNQEFIGGGSETEAMKNNNTLQAKLAKK